MGAVMLIGYQVRVSARWWSEGTLTHRLYAHKIALVRYCAHEGNFIHSDVTEAMKAAILVQRNRDWDGFGRTQRGARWWWQPGLQPAQRRGCVLPSPVLSVSALLHASFLTCHPLFSLLRSCRGFYFSLAYSLLQFPLPGEYNCDYWADVLPSCCLLQLPLSSLLILNLSQPF